MDLRSGLVDSHALSSHLLEDENRADRCNFLVPTVQTFGPSLSLGATKAAWAAIHVVLAFGGRRRVKNPGCSYRLNDDSTVATTPMEVVTTMMQYFPTIEGATLLAPTKLADIHSQAAPPSF